MRRAVLMGALLMGCGGDVVVCPEPEPVPEPAPAERVRVVAYVDAVPGEDTVAVAQCPTGSALVAGGCVDVPHYKTRPAPLGIGASFACETPQNQGPALA